MDNLPELRDIHLPAEGISLFPLAYGWWGILFAGIVLWCFIKVLLWLRRASARLYARHLLESLKDSSSIKAAVIMSEILRRVCLRKYPQAVALSGDQWITFLNEKSHAPLSPKTAELLKNAPFMPEDEKRYSPEEVSDLWQFCYGWIGDNL